MTSSPVGSIWRKWDLHVHTPASHLNNSFGTDWDIYIQKLFRSAIENNIKAIGITDYFTIEGYKQIKSCLNDAQRLRRLFTDEEIRDIKNLLILPNIEFRLNILVPTKTIIVE